MLLLEASPSPAHPHPNPSPAGGRGANCFRHLHGIASGSKQITGPQPPAPAPRLTMPSAPIASNARLAAPHSAPDRPRATACTALSFHAPHCLRDGP
ncbi:hypothetical protein [Lysobacter gummosus]|uniref:hypothetical protein n=1 Tax=Lysobacter gummosus TaxID=262324 RepID=UPI00363AD25A